MDSGITKRIAITDIDFEEIALPTIFRIFESEVDQRIIRIGLYNSAKAQLYAICEFKSQEFSKKVYDNLDGVEIEKTGNIFNLSFIPDDFELDTLIAECTDSEDFRGIADKGQKIEIDENMIDLSGEIEVDFEIPEEFKSKAKVETFDYEKGYKPKVIEEKEESSSHHILEALKEDDEKVETDFKFDPLDERFKDLYEDENFILDASNKKFKLQKSSKVIIEKKFETEEKK